MVVVYCVYKRANMTINYNFSSRDTIQKQRIKQNHKTEEQEMICLEELPI